MLERASYFDHNAYAPMLPEVLDHIGLLARGVGNASSLHAVGRKSKEVVEQARSDILTALGLASSHNLIFTSSGTEANNLLAYAFKDQVACISNFEHPSLDLAIKHHCSTIEFAVNGSGLVDLTELELAIAKHKCALVCVICAHNEIGVIQYIDQISDICKKHGVYLHSDCSQTLGRVDIDWGRIDLLTLASCKVGGGFGCGALVYRKSIHIIPQMLGGGQERGARSGTENVFAISAFAKAVNVVMSKQQAYSEKMLLLRDMLESEISSIAGSESIVCRKSPRLCNTSAIVMDEVKSSVQLMHFDMNGFCVSSGSACSSGKVGRSRAMDAIGLDEQGQYVIRVSLGECNTDSEIKRFIDLWKQLYERLKHERSS